MDILYIHMKIFPSFFFSPRSKVEAHLSITYQYRLFGIVELRLSAIEHGVRA